MAKMSANRIIAMVCVIMAGVVAAVDGPGWGWFLLLALLLTA